MAKRIELRSAHRVTSDAASFRRPAWSPDGRRLVVEAAERGGALYLVDAKGRIEARVTDGAEPSWSPDGLRLAFTRAGSDGRRELWVCDVATPDSARRLAGGDGGVWEHPAWSPDGAQVACASDYGNPAGIRHLWLLDAVQGDRRRITSDPARSDGHPGWSPDGRVLAFDGDDRADDAREIDIYTLEFATGTVTRLTDGTVATRRPNFVDRRYVVAERRSVTGPALVVIDRDKKRTLPVGERPEGEREPSVRLRKKKGIYVAYVRRDPAHDGHDAVWVAEISGVKILSEAEAADEALREAVESVEKAGLPTLPPVNETG
jgi:Tol biopolymer transport system component